MPARVLTRGTPLTRLPGAVTIDPAALDRALASLFRKWRWCELFGKPGLAADRLGIEAKRTGLERIGAG